MERYKVELTMIVEVEAENEDDAIDKAYEELDDTAMIATVEHII